MNKHQSLIVQALESARGDDVHRARHAFRGMTPEQMQQQHGQSGRTRAEILAGYEDRERAIDEALEWLRTT